MGLTLKKTIYGSNTTGIYNFRIYRLVSQKYCKETTKHQETFAQIMCPLQCTSICFLFWKFHSHLLSLTSLLFYALKCYLQLLNPIIQRNKVLNLFHFLSKKTARKREMDHSPIHLVAEEKNRFAPIKLRLESPDYRIIP